MNFATKAIHAGIYPDPSTGAIIPPIYQTSTYIQASPGENKGYQYSRTQNPTRNQLQANLSALENGKHAFCFSSGMAAADAVIKLFTPGSEVIVSDDLYGGNYRMFKEVFQKYGIVFHFISMQNLTQIKKYISKKTRMVWLETPTNPLIKVIDITSIAAIIQEANTHNVNSDDAKILLTVDNTFASPYLQQPLLLGADIVLHSATKYLGGHSDTIFGALILKEDKLAKKIEFLQNTCGAIPGPQDCFLILRGIKTLSIRMEKHCENAMKIAHFLNKHPKVAKVHFPGLSSHFNHDIAKVQMQNFGGMLSFELKDNSIETAFCLIKNTYLFALAESLGGVESLCEHPATMTHASIPRKQREKIGLKDSLIRLSVGIEDITDLIADLEKALTFI